MAKTTKIKFLTENSAHEVKRFLSHLNEDARLWRGFDIAKFKKQIDGVYYPGLTLFSLDVANNTFVLKYEQKLYTVKLCVKARHLMRTIFEFEVVDIIKDV